MADILWEKVVGSKTVSQGGYFDDLLTIARAHVDDAVRANRLTSAQAGEIYTAMIPAAMQQAMQFELSEALTEAQIADVLAKTEIAQKESELNQAILSLQADKLVSDTDITERQMVEQEATGVKQRLSIDKDIDSKNTQIEATMSETIRGDKKLVDELLTTAKQREVIEEDVFNKEWNRKLQGLKIQLDAEVSLYASKRLDDLPSVINGDEDASYSYVDLLDNITRQ